MSALLARRHQFSGMRTAERLRLHTALPAGRRRALAVLARLVERAPTPRLAGTA